jgi:hypothetical protein
LNRAELPIHSAPIQDVNEKSLGSRAKTQSDGGAGIIIGQKAGGESENFHNLLGPRLLLPSLSSQFFFRDGFVYKKIS